MGTPSKRLVADFDRDGVTNGIVCFILSLAGPIAVLLAVSRQAGLDETTVASFIFAGYGFGGVLTILASLSTRKPYCILWTIPGATLLPAALTHISFGEAVGAFMASGLLAVALGASGLIGIVMRHLPVPVVMGMLAGVFLPYGVGLVSAVGVDLGIAGATLLPFVVLSTWPALSRYCPPLLGGLLGGGAYALGAGEMTLPSETALAFVRPEIVAPVFTIQAMLELVLPLTATVVGIHNAQAFVILQQRGHAPAVARLTMACGASSLVFALFGCVPATMASLISAIATAREERRRHYVTTLVFGVLALLLGLFAPAAAAIATALPPSFTALLAGLALLKILEDAFRAAFDGAARSGGLVAFLIAVSGVAPFGVGAAFWALVGGSMATVLLGGGLPPSPAPPASVPPQDT